MALYETREGERTCAISARAAKGSCRGFSVPVPPEERVALDQISKLQTWSPPVTSLHVCSPSKVTPPMDTPLGLGTRAGRRETIRSRRVSDK